MTASSTKKLHIDLETYSATDLITCGVYKYVEDPEFAILLLGYAYDDDPPAVVDLAQGEEIPEDLLAAITDPQIIKASYNANFERACLAKGIGKPMPAYQWECIARKAANAGLPRALAQVCEVLKLKEDQTKMKSGKALIQYFCKPCTPTQANGGRKRNLPHHDLEKWDLFKKYCGQDVVTERAVEKALEEYPTQPKAEQTIWCMDQLVNDYGVRIDLQLVKNILKYNTEYQAELLEKSQELTGLDNPNSLQQLKRWLQDEHDLEVESLNKDSVKEFIKTSDNQAVIEVLKNRQELAKTSVTKYDAMERTVCEDGRIRGMFLYHGASTGRWTGKFVQLHNLPKNKMKTLALARNTLKLGDFELFDMLYDNPMYVFSQLIRTVLIPSDGHVFVIADFSAIEARVLSWLADEEWRNEVFATHGKIYEAAASKMYNVPIEEITKDSPMRAKGKLAELALGYQGGSNAIKRIGGEALGMSDVEMAALVASWRNANGRIVELWATIEKIVENAIGTEKTGAVLKGPKGLLFFMKKKALCIKLPSGRVMVYHNAKLRPGRYKNEITYEGVNSLNSRWEAITTYGGCLVENIVQAISRDILAEAMAQFILDPECEHQVAFHVHDEIVLEVKEKDLEEALEEVKQKMRLTLRWAPGLILTADAFSSKYYMKD